jgi:hypothetical protein
MRHVPDAAAVLVSREPDAHIFGRLLAKRPTAPLTADGFSLIRDGVALPAGMD